jgi:ribosomal protein S18 acetylase RimI-like enzyme
MQIRRLERKDVEPLKRILEATNVFRDEEIETAVELMETTLDQNDDYVQMTAVDEGDSAQGYYCVGPTPMTASTFDLYWIAVNPEHHGKGLGRQLLADCESTVRSMNGSLIVVETSSLPKYEGTRRFYVRNNYLETARIRDYYAPGDDLMIYTKHLQEH